MADKELLITYSVLDDVYKNGSLRYIRGLQDAAAAPAPANVGTIDNPREPGVPLQSTDPDPKMFSYAYKSGVRVLVSKVVTPVSGTAPYTTWSLYEAGAKGFWAELARDIKLQLPKPVPNSPVIATNAYGVAHLGDWLYIVDYDSQKIFTLGTNELNGLPRDSFYKLTQDALDLGPNSAANLPSTAKGQSIVVLQKTSSDPSPIASGPYLFALYTNPTDAYATTYDPSILVRMKIGSGGTPSYDAQCALTGVNSQEIVPVTDATGVVTLLIPSVGGPQQAGGSNAKSSMIEKVVAFYNVEPEEAEWLPTTAVTGAEEGTYDIFAIATPDRTDPNGVVYILTYDYSTGYAGTDWRLYQTSVSGLLNLTGTPTLPAGFTDRDDGTGAPGYFWNILMETGDPTNVNNDRLWFFQGSALLATLARAYVPSTTLNDANKLFPVGTADGQIGGSNVDWADLTIEAVRQALAGKSLKHSVRAAQPPAAAAAAEAEEK
jgi:hypothetical protein